MQMLLKHAIGWATLACVASAAAQNYEITWYTIDGGGGTSSGGGYEVSGTIGQPDAGFASGGGFELDGGFWAASLEGPPPPCLGDLTMDGAVGSSDLNILLSNWDCPDPTDNCQGADLVGGDGDVNSSDLNVLLTAWGPCP